MKKWFLLWLALALPLTGAAAQENEVVVLPTVSPLETVEVADSADYSTASLEEYYSSEYYNTEGENYQAPGMTAEERERAETLLVDYQAGTRPTENVLNKLENAVVGVYTLNPEDYEGETLYTLLPVDPLTDEQILEVIDAFAQCGQTFDPDALTYKNCMRGGGLEVSRFTQGEEWERISVLTDLYVRQGFASEAVYTPLVSDDGLGMVTLDQNAYCGMDCFTFFPCRQMTDDELLSYVIYTETGDPTQYGNYAAYEKQLRLELARLLGAPLVMTRQGEGVCRMGDCNVSYGDEEVYYAYFITVDNVEYGGYLDMETNKVISAYVYLPYTLTYSDLHLDPFDGQWLTVVQDFVSQLREDGMAIRAVESHGETNVQDAGYGVLLDVLMADGTHYEMTIPYQTGTVCGHVDYETSTLDPDQLYAMMYE